MAAAEAEPLTSYELKQSIYNYVDQYLETLDGLDGSARVGVAPVRRPIGVSQGHLTVLKSGDSSVQLADDVVVRPVTDVKISTCADAFQSPVSKSIACSSGGAEHVEAEEPEEEEEGGGPDQDGCKAPPQVDLQHCEGEQIYLKV